MLVTQSAQLQSRLSAKGAVRESRKLEPKLPTGANDVKALPRRRDFETAVDPTKAWAQAVDEATDNFGRVGRAKTTSHEHDQYMWGFCEYLIRQGFGAFVDKVQPGQRVPLRYGMWPTQLRLNPWEVSDPFWGAFSGFWLTSGPNVLYFQREGRHFVVPKMSLQGASRNTHLTFLRDFDE